MRQPKGISGRRLTQALLLGYVLVGMAVSALAQTPSPRGETSPVSTSTPAQVATPSGPQGLAPTPSGQEPLSFPTPLSDRQALADWKVDGSVGTSTFVDNIRRVTWALAFICLAIWAVGKIAGRATLQKWGIPVEADSLIEVLEKRRLSPGRSIMLLRVGPKVLAVAATESGYTTLTEIDAEELKKYQDETSASADEAALASAEVQSPGDIAKHYLSIIPGLGAKK